MLPNFRPIPNLLNVTAFSPPPPQARTCTTSLCQAMFAWALLSHSRCPSRGNLLVWRSHMILRQAHPTRAWEEPHCWNLVTIGCSGLTFLPLLGGKLSCSLLLLLVQVHTESVYSVDGTFSPTRENLLLPEISNLTLRATWLEPKEAQPAAC